MSVGRPKIYNTNEDKLKAKRKSRREWYAKNGSKKHVRDYNKQYYEKNKEIEDMAEKIFRKLMKKS